MLQRLASRLGWSIFTVWAVVTLAFFINNALPADPARAVAGPQARPADVARIRVQLGLDRPIWTQYRMFLQRLVHLGDDRTSREHASCASVGPLHVDLGTSYQMHMPVVRVLGERLPRTLWLALAALAIEVVLGVSAGVVAAVKRNTALDYGAVAIALLGISAPVFLVGVVFQYVLGYYLRWVPFDGYGSTILEHAVSLILPALTLGVAGAAYYTRLVRDDMIDILRQDYVRTARAKGASPWAVVIRHAMRNAVLPLVTVIGLDFGGLLGGAIIVEKLFRWPGLGQLSVDSVFARDAPIILGTVIVSSTAVVVLSFLVDVSYALLDPRVRAR